MDYLYLWLIGIVVVFLQVVLSRRHNVYLGAILPVAYLLFMGWLFVSRENVNVINLILASLGGLTLLSSFWINGRKYISKRRKKELERIQLQDI